MIKGGSRKLKDDTMRLKEAEVGSKRLTES